LQILIGHTRVDALCRLVDVGVNMQDHVVVSDSSLEYYGIRQLLHDDILTYLGLQQMLYNNWSWQYIRCCEGECDKCMEFKEKVYTNRANYMGLWYFRRCHHNGSADQTLRNAIGNVIVGMSNLQTRGNTEGNKLSTGWEQLSEKMCEDIYTVTEEDYRLFCDTVLLPEIVAACAALRYSALRFGGKPGVDYAVPAWDDAEPHLDIDLAERMWMRELESDVCDVLSFGFNMNISHKHDWDAMFYGTEIGERSCSEWWMPTR
jgi:hypothetical protein